MRAGPGNYYSSTSSSSSSYSYSFIPAHTHTTRSSVAPSSVETRSESLLFLPKEGPLSALDLFFPPLSLVRHWCKDSGAPVNACEMFLFQGSTVSCQMYTSFFLVALVIAVKGSSEALLFLFFCPKLFERSGTISWPCCQETWLLVGGL